jgi:hypothetical protein
VARALAIPARLGPRKDVAHFAHFEGYRWDDAPGQVLIARGEAGWSWCIAQDRLSIGIVLHDAVAPRTPEARPTAPSRPIPGLLHAGAARR